MLVLLNVTEPQQTYSVNQEAINFTVCISFPVDYNGMVCGADGRSEKFQNEIKN